LVTKRRARHAPGRREGCDDEDARTEEEAPLSSKKKNRSIEKEKREVAG
jgi:hypothetical protein